MLELCLENYRAALHGRAAAAFEFLSGGLTFSVQAVPVRAEDEDDRIRCSSSPATSPSARTPSSSSRAAPRQQNAVAALGRFALESHDLDDADGRGGDDGDRDARRRRRAASSSSTRRASA